MNKLFILILLLGLTACGGSDKPAAVPAEDDNKPDTTIPDTTKPDITLPDTTTPDTPEEVQFSGTVAMGLAIEGAIVTFTDKDGNDVAADAEVVTDALGNYSATFSETFPVPLLVTITSEEGTLKTIVDDAEQAVVNVNPVTNFVAEQVITEVGLDNVTSGIFSEEGATIVEAAFGDGVSFEAFSTENFVAQNAENTSSPSPADVLLDALSDSADTVGINTLLEEAISLDEPLLEQVQFQVEVAKAASNVELAEPLSSLITTEAADTSQALGNIDSFTEIIDDKKLEVSSDIASSDLSAAEQEAVVSQVVDMAAELVKGEDDFSAADFTQLLDNTDELFTEELVTAVNNTDDAVTEEQMQQIIMDVGEEIVTITQASTVDLTSTEPIVLPVEITEQIQDTIEAPTVIVDSARWDTANWDTLTWQ